MSCMSFGCGRKLECPERTHADTRRTCKLHPEWSNPSWVSNPGPSCCEATVLITKPRVALSKNLLSFFKKDLINWKWPRLLMKTLVYIYRIFDTGSIFCFPVLYARIKIEETDNLKPEQIQPTISMARFHWRWNIQQGSVWFITLLEEGM